MNRSRFLAAVVALGGLLGAAEVRSASTGHQQSLEEFQKRALKERHEQGLDKDRAALFAKYPTPEVKLSGTPPTVSVGSETTITATGRFPPGSLLVVECQGVDLLSQKLTETQLEARVRVTDTAMAGKCPIRVIAPVSLASAHKDVLNVVGNYQWDLSLANGMKARVKASMSEGSPTLSGTSEWFGKDGKAQGTRPVMVDRTPDGFQVRVEHSAEETAAANKARGSISGSNSADQEKQLQDIQAKMQKECMTQPPDKMRPCMKKYMAQITAISQQMQGQAQAAQQKVAAATVGCDLLSLKVSGTQVTGKGNNCGTPGDVSLTGTVKAVK
jgi:hypothetical protein